METNKYHEISVEGVLVAVSDPFKDFIKVRFILCTINVEKYMFHYCSIFNKIAVCFQCVIADNSGDILTIVKRLKNMQIIKNLHHLVGKTKVEISNNGLWSDYMRVTEKSHLIFNDEVNV